MQFEPPTALEYFSTLVADDADLPLIESAASLEQDEDPRFDIQSVLGEIDAMTAQLRRRVKRDASALERLRALNQYFFDELGFSGNVNDYYDPGNSRLSTVLRTRRGIPITLAVLYIELATEIGLVARGVSFPGHFLVKLRLQEGEVVIDPFTGQSLSIHQLDELLVPFRRRQGLEGEFDAPVGLFLQAASAREVLARMLRNLKEIHRSTQDLPRLLAVLDRLIVLLPTAWEEHRDRGLAHAELGHHGDALRDLTVYLRHAGDAVDRRAVRERLVELKRHSP